MPAAPMKPATASAPVIAAPGNAVAAASSARATVMPAAPISAVARPKPITQARTPERRARLEYLTLMLRQLLFKYGLDKGDKLKSVVHFVESRAGATAISGAEDTSQDDASISQLALDVSVRFQTRLEEALVFASYFGVPRDELTVKQMDSITDAFLRLPETAVEGTGVLHIPGFLTEQEVQFVFDAATAQSGMERPTAETGAKANAYPYHVEYGAAHTALFLHREGHFAAFCPKLSSKFQTAMRSQPQMYLSPQVKLAVRCAEFHTYTEGDGLSTKGHRDKGSLLTMSILLSHAHETGGGAFLTFNHRTGLQQPHRVVRGDALLFHSEKMHNVASVSNGVRHSFVMELWQRKANSIDRDS
eukprot:4478231-Prymnesium_polylepis.2